MLNLVSLAHAQLGQLLYCSMDKDGVYLLKMRRYYCGVVSELPKITQHDNKLLALDSMARQARGSDGTFDYLLLGAQRL